MTPWVRAVLAAAVVIAFLLLAALAIGWASR